MAERAAGEWCRTWRGQAGASPAPEGREPSKWDLGMVGGRAGQKARAGLAFGGRGTRLARRGENRVRYADFANPQDSETAQTSGWCTRRGRALLSGCSLDFKWFMWSLCFPDCPFCVCASVYMSVFHVSVSISVPHLSVTVSVYVCFLSLCLLYVSTSLAPIPLCYCVFIS